jgi:FAD:protein FMN transferase
MGSPLRLVTHGSSRARARAAWRAVRADVERTEGCLSRFRLDSDLTLLNTADPMAWRAVPRRLAAMLHALHRAQRVTDGRFDPRVIERLEALGERAGVPLPPTLPDADPAGRWLTRDGRRQRFRTARPVDSGGIGKGLALRWARAAALRELGSAAGFLVEAGGDLVMNGPGPDDGAWSVAIEDPRDPALQLAVLRAAEGAVATSSIAVRHWIGPDGSAVHHLIDPVTGRPAQTGLLAVTVLHADPAWAEVWSKALFLAGSSGIGPEARRRGMAVWWVEADGSLHQTPAAHGLTIWTRERANAA